MGLDLADDAWPPAWPKRANSSALKRAAAGGGLKADSMPGWLLKSWAHEGEAELARRGAC